MDSPKRLDNYFESNREQMLSANYVHLKQYLNQRKSTRKMLNYFFSQRNVLFTNSSENTV